MLDVKSSAVAHTTQPDAPTPDHLFVGGTAIVISGTIEMIPFYVSTMSASGQDTFQWRFVEEAPVEEGEEDMSGHGASTPSWELGETEEHEEEEEGVGTTEVGGGPGIIVPPGGHHNVSDHIPPQAQFPMDHCHRIM